MKICFALVSMYFCGLLSAQWDVPSKVVLDATDPALRQVVGLADPIAPDAAMSLEAARDQVVTYTPVMGTDLLVGTLDPAPTAYVTGMVVTLLPIEKNRIGAQLDLNGLGAVPLLRSNGAPVDSSDLVPGSPARVVFDGTGFRMLGSIRLPCPPGYTSPARDFCIADTSQSAETFFQANMDCRFQRARLCTISEWVTACNMLPGFLPSVTDFEWVDHAANHTSNAKLIGYGSDGVSTVYAFGCRQGLHDLPSNPYRFRCCTSR